MIRLENTILNEQHIVSISPYFDKKNVIPLLTDEEEHVIMYTTYDVGAKIKDVNGDIYYITRADKCKQIDYLHNQEKILHDAEQYAIDIAKLIFPRTSISTIKIGGNKQ